MKKIIHIITVSLLIQAFSVFGMQVIPINKSKKTLNKKQLAMLIENIIPYLKNDQQTIRNLYLTNRKVKKILESQLVRQLPEKRFLKHRESINRFIYLLNPPVTSREFFNFYTIEKLSKEICQDIVNNNFSYFTNNKHGIVLKKENFEKKLSKILDQVIDKAFERAKTFSKPNCLEKSTTCNNNCGQDCYCGLCIGSNIRLQIIFCCCCLIPLCLISLATIGIPFALLTKVVTAGTIVAFILECCGTFLTLTCIGSLITACISCLGSCSILKKRWLREDIQKVEMQAKARIKEILQKALENILTEEELERIGEQNNDELLRELYEVNPQPSQEEISIEAQDEDSLDSDNDPYLANADIQYLSGESSSEAEEMV